MKTLADGTRYYEQSDVDRERVHAAMTAVGRKLTADRLAEIAARGGKQCNSVDGRTHLPCTNEALATYLVGPRCRQHTPAAERGRDEPVQDRCQHPTRCYCSKHRSAPLDEPARDEHAWLQQELDWQRRVIEDIQQLARMRIPFSIAQLVVHLPPARSAERPIVEQAVRALLDQGVDRGVIVKHPQRDEWKGAS